MALIISSSEGIGGSADSALFFVRIESTKIKIVITLMSFHLSKDKLWVEQNI